MDAKRIVELKEFYHNSLLNDIVPFWLNSDLIDKEYGGFITSVDREGKQYNADKSVWFQGRCLWTFSKLCNTYGAKKEWALEQFGNSVQTVILEGGDEDGN